MKMFQLVSPNLNVNWLKWSRPFLLLSLLALSLSIYLVLTKGFNFGIDFTGGTVAQIIFAEPKTAEEVRKLVNELGDEGASVVAMGDESREYLITSRTQVDESKTNKLVDNLLAKVGKDKVEIERVDVVGPKVGAELKWSALKALFYSIILIMVYIWFRFDFKFAPGATAAMVHDLIIMCGVYVLSGREFTIASVAALLTIAGYSVNDTIVIYDRARELFKAGGDNLPVGPTINKALNQTFSRTILTSLLTFLSIVGLLLYTEGEIQSFAFALAIGIIVGCYSTIFIAAPFTIFIDKLATKRAK